MLNKYSKSFAICGLALCAVGGYAGYSVVNAYQQPVQVVVATQNIDPHTQITGSMVKTIEIPAGGRSESAIDDTSVVVGGYSTTKIYAGQQIIQPQVAKQFDETGAAGVALSIPDETLRAVSFPTDSASTANGNIQKGDYVDIIATIDGSKNNTGVGLTKTILQSIEVMDIAKDESAATNITLPLTRGQPEFVKYAYTKGEVIYALNPGNSHQARTAGVTDKSFMERIGLRVVPAQQQNASTNLGQ